MDISYSSTIRIPLYVDDFQDFHTFLVVSLDGLGILAKLNVNTKSSSSSKWNRRRVIIKMSIRNVRKLLRHADLLHLFSVRLSIKSWVANFRNKKSAFPPLAPPCPFRKLNVSHVWTTYRNLQKGGRKSRRVRPKALGHTHKLRPPSTSTSSSSASPLYSLSPRVLPYCCKQSSSGSSHSGAMRMIPTNFLRKILWLSWHHRWLNFQGSQHSLLPELYNLPSRPAHHHTTTTICWVGAYSAVHCNVRNFEHDRIDMALS